MMKVFKYSGVGRRNSNQDCALALSLGDDEGIFIVADGMGGYANGAEAAELVANAIKNYVVAHISNILPEDLLKQALSEANQQLSISRLTYGCARMGSVVVVVLILAGNAYCTWLGDSRIYLYRDNKEIFVSNDHSALKEWGVSKVLSPKQIEQYSNIVTRAIMGDDDLGPIEVTTLTIQKGDTFFLCSDGIHKTLEVSQMPTDDTELFNYLNDNNELFSDNYTLIKLTL